jgi:hypothetical protein
MTQEDDALSRAVDVRIERVQLEQVRRTFPVAFLQFLRTDLKVTGRTLLRASTNLLPT